MSIGLRRIAGLVAGCLTAVTIALVATGVARITWPAYAAAEPNKTYSFVMLVVRLLVGGLCTAGAACVASIIVRDNGRSALLLGLLFLAISLPDHRTPLVGVEKKWQKLVAAKMSLPAIKKR
jgi:hypothetical protein